jgi:hypothetical protein
LGPADTTTTSKAQPISGVAAVLLVILALSVIVGGLLLRYDERQDENALPQCRDTWILGEELPADYAGCAYASGAVDAARVTCADGSTLFVFAGRLTASPGGSVTAGFSDAYVRCVA